ncbi:hypothetical protein M8C21_016744, partial [Ambrosia artemisiifolia]
SNHQQTVKLDDEQLTELREIFRSFDRNNDGSLTQLELGSLLRSLGLTPSPDQLDALIQKADTNSNGFVEFSEFVALVAPELLPAKSPYTDDQLKQLFKMFDRDGNGFITAAELAHSMAKLGHALTAEELTGMIKEADTDGDGRINFQDYFDGLLEDSVFKHVTGYLKLKALSGFPLGVCALPLIRLVGEQMGQPPIPPSPPSRSSQPPPRTPVPHFPLNKANPTKNRAKNSPGLLSLPTNAWPALSSNHQQTVKLDDEQLTELREIFRSFDRNNDGSLTQLELGSLLRSLGLTPSPDQLDALIQKADTNSNGFVEFSEFVALVAPELLPAKSPYTDDQLKQLFKMFDRDGNGFITAAELAHSMAKLGHALTAEELTGMIKEADTDGDGRINFQEWLKNEGASPQLCLCDRRHVVVAR